MNEQVRRAVRLKVKSALDANPEASLGPHRQHLLGAALHHLSPIHLSWFLIANGSTPTKRSSKGETWINII
jgi:hypothetical protein